MADVALDYDDFLIMIEKMLNDELGNDDSALHLFTENGVSKLIISGDAIIRRAAANGIENTLLVDVDGLTYAHGKKILFEVGNDTTLIGNSVYAEGNITVENSNASMVVTNGTRRISLLIGSGGINRGIYDGEKGKWILYSDDTNINIITNASSGKLKVNSKDVSMDGHSHVLDDLPSEIVTTSASIGSKADFDKVFTGQPNGTVMAYRLSSAGCQDVFGFSAAAMIVFRKSSTTAGDGVFVSNGTRKLAHIRLSRSGGALIYSMDYATTTNVTGTISIG